MTVTSQGQRGGVLHGARWTVLLIAVSLLTAGSVAVRPRGLQTRVLGDQFDSSTAPGNSGCGNGEGRERGNSTPKDCTPPGKAIMVTGEVLGSISPGSSTTLRLVIQNPNNQDLIVEAARALVGAPSDANCRSEWFLVTPYAGVPSLTVRKNSSATLDLDLYMLDEPVNQDSCKAATIPLSFTATATGA